MYAWNKYWSDTHGEIDLNLDDAVPGTPDYFNTHLQYNRDAYNEVSSSAQASQTTPFNGATGMGFGTLANRPTTCTTNPNESGGGVGYFATDDGPQGTLYQCYAPSTWKVWYKPYSYPCPLQGHCSSSSISYTTILL